MSYNKCNECTDMCAWEYTHQMENTEEGEGGGGGWHRIRKGLILMGW